MKNGLILAIIVLSAVSANAIYRVELIKHEELPLEAEEILHLPGLGLGVKCGVDSVMLLDNVDLPFIRWVEPNNARSIVACSRALYAAEGDSIYRVATDSLPRRFSGRLDNDQFTLSTATDTTFFAITADENFSCVYEFNPTEGYCDPIISIEAPLMKIFRLGGQLLLWVDDTLLLADQDGAVAQFFTAPNITDVAVTPFGVIIATNESVLWLTKSTEGIELLPFGVSDLWWDSADVLYYRTMQGDIYSIVGLNEEYRHLQ